MIVLTVAEIQIWRPPHKSIDNRIFVGSTV